EQGSPDDLFASCAHPYTRALLEAVPRVAPGAARRRRESFVTASHSAASDGCPYAPRCPLADQHCRDVPPRLREIGPNHLAACHKAEAVMALPPFAEAGSALVPDRL